MADRDPDFVVIGSGPNGLTAAAVLARAGASVTVLEAHPSRAGGAVGSEQATLPGFVHDVGASFFTFGKTSPAFRELDLAAHDVEWLNADFESCHPAPDGSVAAIARDPERTALTFGSTADGETWRRLALRHRSIEDDLLAMLLGPIPAMRPALRLAPSHAVPLARIFTSSGSGLSCRLFRSEAARRVIPGLALHADIGPGDLFGAGLGYMLATAASTGGFSVPRGGARAVAGALERILAAHGGTLLLGRRATRVIVRERRAVAVVTANGEEHAARRGVLADTAAPALLDLVGREHLPSRLVRGLERFRYGWPTFKMDWALERAVPWTSEPARRSAVVHAGDDLEDLARFASDVRAGRLPAHPYLVIGQQSLVDPSRAPLGRHTLWAYTHVPRLPPDAWAREAEAFADRIEERIEGLAPGFRRHVLARRIVAPPDLERMDANLVEGDLGGGTNAWTNQLLFRPVFPWFRYRMPVRGLWLCSSYTHPGAGVHGMCGYNAAQVAIRWLAPN
jgi:phytoene dehydrogenase-like protein